MHRAATVAGYVAGGLLLVLLLLPVAALLVGAGPTELLVATGHPLFAPALLLSLQTTATSLLVVVALGTPLAWWLATARRALATTWAARSVEAAVALPIVVPPAVVGVGLLAAFGRQGLLGPSLQALGLALPFSTAAVVVAQVVVSAPFYVQAAASAFARVDPELVAVARTLGASPTAAFARVVLPCARDGLVAGAALAWARSLGEFGATLLFAGNLTGRTQTLPLAIFTALEQDVPLAMALSLGLAATGAVVLVGLRRLGAAPSPWASS